MGSPALSIVVAAYNASATLPSTLRSIFVPGVRSLPEVVVVDDGSPDRCELERVVQNFDGVRLIHHATNLGICASRNTGVRTSNGDVLAILDADDELVPDWPDVFEAVLSEWPTDVGVCFSACRNRLGQPTVREPEYRGPMTLDDFLNERYAGEYLPIFRGDYIRARGYVDLHLKKSCGVVSYLTMISDGPFWVTPRVLRVYNEARPGSVTSAWAEPAMARESARCYEALFERFQTLYRARARRAYRIARLRYAVYLALAGERGAFRAWRSAAGWTCVPESLMTLTMIGLGRSYTKRVVAAGRRLGLVKRYG